MKFKLNNLIFPVFIATLFGFLFVFNNSSDSDFTAKISKMRSSGSPKAKEQTIKEREEYFFNKLRDPKINAIPRDAVKNDMKFAEQFRSRRLAKTNNNVENWQEAGPNDVGGRTRALAVDVRDPNVVLAGGVSGGIWKTTDKGATWEMKFTKTQNLSVSNLAQDTRAGHEDTWYASTGEISGNSAGASGAPFRGAGIYKSTDNGDNWELLAKVDDILSWDHELDYISKIKVHPVTGSLFISSNSSSGASWGGIYKSVDEGLSFTRVLATDSRYSEFDIAANGSIVAVLSEDNRGSGASTSGVWLSQDDGASWTDITPSSYPLGSDYGRGVVAIAPSNNDICYILQEVDDGNQDNRLYKLNLSNNTSEDLSANMPDFDGNGIFNAQGGYNLMVAIAPTDENLVIIGGTNIYRSFDGFSTPLGNDIDNEWIGGYDPAGGSYLFSHPDIHSFSFESQNSNRMWVGHDGGLSYTANIFGKKNVDFGQSPWNTKNNGYNVTQVYDIDIPNVANDYRIMIGCQDNGTPNFEFDGTPQTIASRDVSSGDGSYCYFGSDYAYVSTQNGSIIQLGYDPASGVIPNIFQSSSGVDFAFIHPSDNLVSGQLFINPYVVNPKNENVMFYPAGTSIWKNTHLKDIPRGGGWGGQDEFWEKMDNLEAPAGYTYTAINVSTDNSSHTLYVAAYNQFAKPVIYRLAAAIGNTNPAFDVSVPDLPVGAYIEEIAINPNNSSEILVVATNYNIVGLYYSSDAGASYTAVEGNLEGVDGKGPSMRSAFIMPTSGGSLYLVGTSVGLFSTTVLNGSNTVWEQEGPDVIGNVVVESIDARASDRYIAIGTHGRGVFTGTAKNVTVGIEKLDELPVEYSLSQNYPNPFNPSTKIRYSVPIASNVSLKIFDINGQEIANLVNEYLPAGSFEVDWNGLNNNGVKVASGAYIYRLNAGDFTQTKKMIMLK